MLHSTVSACVFDKQAVYLRAWALEHFSCKFYFSLTFIYINFYVEVTAALFVSPQCQYYVCIPCNVSNSLSLFPIALLSPFVFVMSVAVSHSSILALKAVVPSRSLSVCLMVGLSTSLLCFACDITALFSLLSQYLSCHLSVASVLC